MKNFFRYAAVALVGLFALGSCSSDDTDEQSGRAALAQPEVTVRDLTTTGFTLRWNSTTELRRRHRLARSFSRNSNGKPNTS